MGPIESIARRIAHGGSPADVRREIIDPSPFGEDERFSVATRPEVRRAAQPLARLDGAEKSS